MNEELNIYDQAVLDSMSGAFDAPQPDPVMSAKIGYGEAFLENPDAQAEALRISRRIGMPVQSVLDFPDVAKKQNALSEIDFETLANVSPTTASLLDDIDQAKVIHPDVENLSMMERILRTSAELPKGMGGSANKSSLALNYALGTAPLLYDAIAGGDKATAWWYENMLRPLEDAQREFNPDPQTGIVGSLANSFGSLLQDLATISSTGGGGEAVTALTEFTGMQSGAEISAQALEHGFKSMLPIALASSINTGRESYEQTGDGTKAVEAAAAQYFSTSMMGAVPMSAPGGLFSRVVMGGASGLGSGWATHEYMQSALGTDAPFSIDDAIISTITGGVFGAFGHGYDGRMYPEAAQLLDKMARSDAVRDKVRLDALDKVLSETKYRERDPEGFAQLVQAIVDGDGSEEVQQKKLRAIWVDAQTMADAMQKHGVTPEEIARKSPRVAEQFAEASQTGGLIKINIADYALNFSGSKIGEEIKPFLRTDPEGMSFHEFQQARTQQQDLIKQAAEAIISKHADASEWEASRTQVHDTVLEELNNAGSFSPDVNRSYATLQSSFFTVLANDLGVKPHEAFEQYRLKIGGADPADPRILNQSVYHGSPHRFDKFSLDHVGNGEGAQAYGYGLYFAGKKEVAEFYKDKLTQPIVNMDKMRDAVAAVGGSSTEASTSLKNIFEKLSGGKSITQAVSSDEYVQKLSRKSRRALVAYPSLGLEALRREIGLDIGVEGGQLYKVDIPEDDVMLHWDSPLSEQPEKVREALRALIDKYDGVEISDLNTREDYLALLAHDLRALPSMKGDRIYHMLKEAFLQDKVASGYALKSRTDKAASEYLNRLGIKGIKYLDGTSRGAGDGSHNYVIFDDQTIKILETFYQQDNKIQRGQYIPDEQRIRMLEKADLSTFIHESGHFFLDTYARIASGADAPAKIKEAMDTTVKWFGVESLEKWNAMSLDEQRPYHEQFAQSFERYLLEGKAPSVELQGIFQRVRAYMIAVYKSLFQSGLHEAPDEMKAVFDRMLATDEEIARAESVRGFKALFEEKPGDMPDAEWEDFQRLAMSAHADAIDQMQARSLKDMKWLSNARSKAVKQIQAAAKAEKAKIRDEVTKEVMEQPVRQADAYLRREGGIDPDSANRDISLERDVIAEMFGFHTGKEMMDAIRQAGPVKVEIATKVDQRMLERHGELIDPKAIADAADEAVHNEARSRLMATGLRYLAKANMSSSDLFAAAREAATEAIARRKVGEISAKKYLSDESRSYKRAIDLAPNDPSGAGQAMREALLSNQLYRKSLDAERTVEKGLRFVSRFNKDSILKNIDAEFVDQIMGLLEQHDFRKSVTGKERKGRATLKEWYDSQVELGLEPDISDKLLTDASKKHYKDMTFEDFESLMAVIKQIEFMGRKRKMLLTAKDKVQYETARNRMRDTIIANAGDRAIDPRTARTETGAWFQSVKSFWAEHIKAATWARIMDGGRDGGSVWEYLIRPANERGDMETRMRADATQKAAEILSPVFKIGRMGGKGEYFSSVNDSFNREGLLAIALNYGNESNAQRLLGGQGWTDTQVRPLLEALTAEELRAVQKIWDLFESYRPMIAAKERRLYGKEPQWIEPRPLTVKSADGETVNLRGGYYPVKFDPQASQHAEAHADAEAAKQQMRGAHNSATTRRSFTKKRVEAVTGRPLLYNLSGLYSGLNEVIHDLSWHEWLVDANRLMRSNSIDSAIREKYGPEVKQQFKAWVQDIAEGDRSAANSFERFSSRLRQGISASGLSFNIVSALMQPVGITQSVVRVGGKWVGRGVAKYLSNPPELTQKVNEMSSFMNERARTRFRELNELRGMVQETSTVKEFTGTYGYWMMMKFQQMVDVPTWWGAYEKSIHEGNDDSRSRDLADQAVIDSQGSGMTKDLARIERGGPLQKLFTTFYSFMNTALNIGTERTMKANTVGGARARGRHAAEMLMLYAAPVVLTHFFKNAITPGDSDDKDLKSTAKNLAAEGADYMLGQVVGIREFSGVFKALAGISARSYSGPGGLGMIGSMASLATQAHQGEFDDAFRKSLVDVSGKAFGLPGAQVNRTITGAQALVSGKTHNPVALATGFQGMKVH